MREDIDRHVRETVARLPDPTPEQLNAVAAILYRAGKRESPIYRPAQDPSEAERMREQARKNEELRRVRAYAREVMGCAVCGIAPEGHTRSAGLHEWEARQDILKLTEKP
jgi:hypothetical protein